MKMVGINCKKNMLAFGSILLLIVLLSGMALVPAIYVGATIQLQQPQQQQTPQQEQQLNQQTIGVSQIVKQIANKVAAANPGTNAASVEQVLTELAKQKECVNRNNPVDIQKLPASPCSWNIIYFHCLER
jgi:hypothetical protein